MSLRVWVARLCAVSDGQYLGAVDGGQLEHLPAGHGSGVLGLQLVDQRRGPHLTCNNK